MSTAASKDSPDRRWQIDRHIPVAVILAIVGQGAGIVWWGSSVQHIQRDHERRITAQESAKSAERMAVVEAQVRDTQELQREMNRKLDRLLEARTAR